ncbi:hypothetical protein KY345_03605 [Candidatus Woesearchaeota archaeon]|nr:hypothetical protein [Candidatus Woesearchaeota archaeon]
MKKLVILWIVVLFLCCGLVHGQACEVTYPRDETLVDDAANKLGSLSDIRIGTESAFGTTGEEATAQAGAATTTELLTADDMKIIGKLQRGEYDKLTDEELEKSRELLRNEYFETFLSESEIQDLQKKASDTALQRKQLDDQLKDYGKDFDKLAGAMSTNQLRELEKRAKKLGSAQANLIIQARRRRVRREREQRIEDNKDWISRVIGSLKPNVVGRQFEDWLEKARGRSIGIDLLTDPRVSEGARNFFGYGVSGYEHAICDGIIGGPVVVQDYPGHYMGGGDLPNLDVGRLVLLGRRSEYEKADWKKPDGTPRDDKWFPEIQPDGTVVPKGYLYKISWTVFNHFRQITYDAMEDYERDEEGLFANGTIKYKVIIKGTDPDGKSVEYEWNEKILEPVPLNGQRSETYSFYDKSKFTTIELVFEKNDKGYAYRYNGQDSKLGPIKIEVKDYSSQIPEGFDYFPVTEQTGDGITYTKPDGTVVQSKSSECDLPRPLCCQQGLTQYCD